jgi:Rrf2 family protein
MPERFLLQVLRSLVTQGILRSTRGVEGGYSLRKAASELTLLEVIEAVDGPLQSLAPSGEEIPTQTRHRLENAMEHVNQQSRDYLSQITFASLLREASPPMSLVES